MSHKSEIPDKSQCRTCREELNKADPIVHCVTRAGKMHLTESCTFLSKAALNGIKELGLNALLICDDCVELKKRDELIEKATDES